MEITTIVISISIVFALGIILGRITKDTTDSDFWRYLEEIRKRQEAEIKLAKIMSEHMCWRSGNYDSPSSCIVRENIYRKGVYDGRKAALDEKIYFKTISEQEEMLRKLTDAMKPLEDLRKEISI